MPVRGVSVFVSDSPHLPYRVEGHALDLVGLFQSIDLRTTATSLQYILPLARTSSQGFLSAFLHVPSSVRLPIDSGIDPRKRFEVTDINSTDDEDISPFASSAICFMEPLT